MSQMDRRQFVAGTALLLPALLGLNACAASGSNNQQGQAGSGDKFVFKHGFDRDFPPYSFIDDTGKTTGFDVEMAQLVCEKNGWEYKAVPIDWDAKDVELNAKSCDCIWSGFVMHKDNKDAYTWTEPYSNNSQMIMVKSDSPIKTLTDLAGKKVGVQRGTSTYELLKDDSADGKADLAKTFASLEVYDTFPIATTDLIAGGIDAIAIDVTIGNYLISENPSLKFLDEILSEEIYAIAFRKGETELRDKVWNTVLELVKSGKFDEVGKKYPDIYDSLILGK